MDIKSKNNKIIMTLGVMIAIGIAALTMLANYPEIRKHGQKYETNFFDSYIMSRELATANYVLYYNTMNKESATYLAPSRVLINDINTKSTYNLARYQDEIDHQKGRFDNYVKDYNKNTLPSYKNLDFVAINTENGLIEEDHRHNIKLLHNGEVDLSTFDTERYQFYLILRFDEKGRMSVQSTYGTDDSYIQEHIMDKKDSIFNCRYFEMRPIKNMTYIYGVPKELVQEDFISRGIYSSQNSSYASGIGNGFVVVAIVLLVVGLLIPVCKAEQIVGFKRLIRIPLEFILLGVFFAIVAVVLGAENILGEFIRSGSMKIFENMGYTTGTMWTINFVFWVVIFGICLSVGLMIRYIGYYGFVKYLKEKSIIVRMLIWLLRCIKKWVKSCGQIDLRDKNTKSILKIVLCNAVVLTAIANIWFFGRVGVVAYSIFLFVFLRRKVKDISHKYNKLLEATQKIAEGNLEVKIEEDLGLFELFKHDLERIQDGFKKAVDEEVKSQKMKTELISNVSHDLKTPLTSIITYIDLVKDENLPLEKQREYLDILDRKADRLKILIEDLFEVSKATSGNIVLNKELVDVVSLMKQTLLVLEDKIEGASLIVREQFPEGKVLLYLDSQRMFRVFENLVLNITKYAMAGSRVYIDIIEKDHEVEIILKNMAAEEIHCNIESIVERFVRGDESRHTEGSGLGLAIAKSFVELHGGKLAVSVDGDLFKVSIRFILAEPALQNE